MRRALLTSFLLISTLARADGIPPPLSPSEIPASLGRADLPRADPPLVAQAPAGPSGTVLHFGWSEADTRAAASALARDCVAGAWLERWQKARRRKPGLTVSVRNRSSSMVNTVFLERELRASLGRSSRLAMVQPKQADLLVLGLLTSQNDANSTSEVQSYLLGISLIDLETGEKLWLGIHRVRRLVERSSGKVTPLTLGTRYDLSGFFTDVDAETMTGRLLRDLHAGGWLKRATPIVRLAVLNRTSETVSTAFIAMLLEHGLQLSGRVRLVGRPEETSDPRPPRRALSPSHLLEVWLSTAAEASGTTETRRYQLSITATSVAESSKVFAATTGVTRQIRIAPPRP
jgi:hypothetical protein